MVYKSLHGREFGFDPATGEILVNMIPTMGIGYRGRGRTFYVSSVVGASGATGSSPDQALATLDAAFAKCEANRGDVIIVMHDHAETITGAAGIAHDVAGVTVIGLGVGNQRPRFLMDGSTAVTYAITADDAVVRNLVFAAGHADIVACITTTKKHTWIDGCEFVNNVVDENFLTEIKATSTSDNASDGLKVTNCRALTVDASALEFIEINADVDGAVIRDNLVCKDAATSGKFLLCATGKDLTNVHIEGNRHVCGMTTGDVFIDNDTTANSGLVVGNRVGHHDTAAVVLIDCDGVRLFDNLSASEDTTSGLLRPAADDDS